jgi:hypothetical protein
MQLPALPKVSGTIENSRTKSTEKEQILTEFTIFFRSSAKCCLVARYEAQYKHPYVKKQVTKKSAKNCLLQPPQKAGA